MRRALDMLLALLVAGVAVISLLRGLGLAADGWVPTAPGERRWLGWAGGSREERALFGELVEGPLAAEVAETPPARGLFLEVEGPSIRSDWVQVMAQYAWPEHRILGVASRGEGGEQAEPPAGARTLRVVALAVPTGEPPFVGEQGVLTLGSGSWPALVGACLMALVVGANLVPRRLGVPPLAAAALTGVLGLTLLVPAALVAGLAGLPPIATSWGLAAAGAAALLALGRRRGWFFRQGSRNRDPGHPERWGRLADAVLIGALAVFCWKVLAAPLWSWDHFAIWGFKARRLAAVGVEPGLFAAPAFRFAAAQYPLGVPAGWVLLALGRLPAVAVVKGAHVLGGVALAVLVRSGVRSAGASRLAAGALASMVAASPLFWDTESLGLADLPLALWAVAAVVSMVALPPADVGGSEARAARLLPAGLLLGALPWIKQDGLALAVLLAAGLSAIRLLRAPASARGREGLRLVLGGLLPALAMVAAERWVTMSVGGEGLSFLAGDWQGRALARLGSLPALLRLLAGDLLAPHWLGFWLLFAAGLGLAFARRRWPGVLLAGVVVAQLTVYAFVYLATYLDPAAHIASSFLRISAAQLPLAAVALGFALAPSRGGRGAVPEG